MLYRTHHPFSFPCNPFSSSKLSPLSLSSASQVEKEMECELKGGVLRPEIVVGFCPKQQTPTQTAVFEEFCNFSPQNAPVSGEDFFVDQLLNFSNEDAVEEAEQEEGEDKDVVDESGFLVSVKEEPFEEELQQQPPNSKKASPFLSPPPETDRNRDDFGSVLSVPAEEADLEWLSHFVEESFSQFSTPFPTGFKPNSEKTKPKPEPGSEPRKPRSFTPPASLSKAPRSKRARTGGRVWSNPNPVHDPVQPKKRETGSVGPPRRCSHCGVQKTPQWRTGPLGAKTLCNACGVRFKSGRLLPEYRPACSPTFSSELHSNNHRKVLEMRKKKEMNSSLSHPVPSFG